MSVKQTLPVYFHQMVERAAPIPALQASTLLGIITVGLLTTGENVVRIKYGEIWKPATLSQS